MFNTLTIQQQSILAVRPVTLEFILHWINLTRYIFTDNYYLVFIKLKVIQVKIPTEMQKKNKKQLHACKHYQRTEQCCQITEPSQLKMHVEIYTKLLPILFFKCLWKQSNNTGARLGRIQDSPKESTGLQIINRNLILKKVPWRQKKYNNQFSRHEKEKSQATWQSWYCYKLIEGKSWNILASILKLKIWWNKLFILWIYTACM